MKGSLTGVSSVKLALMAKQARTQLGTLAMAEPIAIVGMGCRFPGGADSPAAYWSLLRDGVDAVGEMPTDRWDLDAVYDPDPATPGKTSVRVGGFLDRVDEFDAAFFGIPRREAERMDPQHRIFLEVAIDALDHAGLPRERLAGSATGVFIASYYNDYAFLQLAQHEEIDARTMIGTQHSVLANRLSYVLDLRGPSLSIDTACSSSLVAVHLACQSLRTGECDAALAGGVSLMLSPEMMIALTKVGFVSASGRCRTFDALADGFIRGEGCGVVVLKRLSDAIADGDRVLAVVRGSAVNQDGRSTVLTAPNGLAQQALVRAALANAQIEPGRVGLIEAHGTATPLGDPIEVEALAATAGAPRADGSVCYLGSVKANLGHLEAAAGVAGLIKATLALQHRQIPGQLHFTTLNPHLSLAGTSLMIADRLSPWPAASAPRVAGVSSFGVGGTNAHVILEEAPALPAVSAATVTEPHLLPLSAEHPQALTALASRWIRHLATMPAPLTSLAATAAQRRSHYEHRLAIVASSKEQLATQLQAVVDGDPSPTTFLGRSPRSGAPRVAFVFSGQGAQWAGMGRELADREPVFRDVLVDLDERMQRITGWSLLAELRKPAEASRLHETEVAQPAIFAVQVALAALWETWGVRPDAVVGHSVGEIAAMHVAGMLSLDDSVRIVCHRGRIMQRATGGGRMVAADMDASAADALVREIGAELALAAVNAPRSVVLSGTEAALDTAVAQLDARGIAHRQLLVTYAFHSAQMDPLQADLIAALGQVSAQPGHATVYSTVTGTAIDHTRINGGYFGRNMRLTVRFADAVAALLDGRADVIVELAPHPVLSASVVAVLAERQETTSVVASMRRGRPERETMLAALGALYVAGHAPRWKAITAAEAVPLDLPAYPWQRERFWLPHPTVAHAVPASGDDVPTWLKDHQISGRTIMPAAVLLERLHSAASSRSATAVSLVDFVVHQPLFLDEPHRLSPRTAQDAGHEAPDAIEMWASLPAASCAERRIATGRMVPARVAGGTVQAPACIDGEWRTQTDALYAAFDDLGARFGPAFRTVERWRVQGDLAEGWLSCSNRTAGTSATRDRLALLIDGALQLCDAAAGGGIPKALLLPIAIDAFTVYAKPSVHVRAIVHLDDRGAGGSVAATIRLVSEHGELIAVLDGVRFAPVRRAPSTDAGPYHVRWQTIGAATTTATTNPSGSAAGTWIVLTGGNETSAGLVRMLTNAGGRCVEIEAATHSTEVADGRCAVAPFDANALRACLIIEGGRHHPLVRGVIHMWSLASDAAATEAVRDWLTTGSALTLLQAMDGPAFSEARLWFTTRGAQPATGLLTNPAAAGLWGFANVVSAERPDLPCHVVDLDPCSTTENAQSLLAELTRPEPDARVALRGATRYAPRLERLTPAPRVGSSGVNAAPARLSIGAAATLDGIAWTPDRAAAPRAGEVRVRVLAAGLNFRDVLRAVGMYPAAAASGLGAECAGVVEDVGDGVALQRGDVVFGFAPGSLASDVTVPARFLAPMPAALRVEDAAALPAAFLTAMYALQRVAGLAPGARVLIQAAAGGVGLAALQIARRRGAEVFATASSPAKRDYLRSLGVEHVFSSRTTAFAESVLQATGGAGVDVVLNSLSDEFIPAGVRALGTGGWFIELGKRGVWTPEEMAAARPDARYRIFDFGVEADGDPGLVSGLLEELCSALVDGSLHPLPIRVFDFAQAQDAFRVMAQAGHIGKLVLRAPVGAPAGIARADATYWITGGAGALGARTARWLVDSGARCLVLTGRHAPTAAAQRLLDECVVNGARIEFRIADAGDAVAMTRVFDEIQASMPPLRGVVHAAGAIDAAPLADQTWPRWRAVLDGKAGGARVLDALTRRLDLDFFVLYSAAAWLLGPAGQGAYAAANAELDAIAWSRKAAGFPALSVNWGQWRDAGMARRMVDAGHDPWSARGLGWIAAREGFAELERLVASTATVAAVLPIDWTRFLAQLPAGVDATFFQALGRTRPAAPAAAATADPSLIERWRQAPQSERRTQLLAHLAERARHILGVDHAVVLDERSALKDQGLDSLMSVEFRNALTRSLRTSLPATLLFDYPSLETLATYLLRALDLGAPESSVIAPASAQETAATDEVATLSDAEAEALLLAELNAGSGVVDR